MAKTGDNLTPEQARLRILATSDVHAHLLAWDYHADRAAPDRGLTRIATLIARLRKRADLCLLLDNGDFLQGSPLGDAAALGRALGPGGIHPAIAAMNALHYDAAALGNHEFSHGLDLLLRALDQARFPILSANILTARGETPLMDRTFLPATALLQRHLAGHDLMIGLIGLTPPQTLTWEASHIDRPLLARDMIEAAAAQAADLKARGADVVVALCHAGVGDWSQPTPRDAEAEAIAGLPGIDAVIAGHTHRTFPDATLPARPGFDPLRGRIHGRPVVSPGFNGSHLGVIDLVLTWGGKGWMLTGRRGRLLPVAARGTSGRMSALVPEDPALRAIVLPAHDATRAWASQTVGASGARSATYFALVAPCEPVRLVARAKTEAVRQALAGRAEAALPLLATAAPYRAGGRGGPGNYTILPRGVLTLRNLTDLYPHPNTLVAVRLTGAEVAEWLERSAALYRQITPGAHDAELIDSAFPFFNFDSIEGVTYRFDLSAPSRYDVHGQLLRPESRRLRDLCLNGQPLAPDRAVILATNSYRLSGIAGLVRDVGRRVVYRSDEPSRNALHRFIAALCDWPQTPPPNWGFLPMPATSAVIDSAPAAVEFIAAAPGLRVEPLDLRPDGFRRFRLHLD
jgi:2',3'-cyclic-nucleotide 2'-phosphodiesterase/3'-nucleotidase